MGGKRESGNCEMVGMVRVVPGWEVCEGGHGISEGEVESEGMMDWRLKFGRKQGEKWGTAAIAFLQQHSSVAL